MKELIHLALETAKDKGATYADIRIIRSKTQSLATEDRRVAQIDDLEDYGFGIRVIADGSWGFACSGMVNKDEITKVSTQAVEIANASALTRKGKGVYLIDEPPYVDRWKSPLIKNPFEVPIDAKINLLLMVNEEILKVNGIKKAFSMMFFKRQHKFFGNTQSALIETDLTTSMVFYQATAVADGEAKTRTYMPPPLTKGYELIEEARLLENARRVAEEAVERLSAKPCPAGEKDLILDPAHLALTIHESVGHPTELDRALGMEESLAGRSFATPDKRGKLQYGSKLINFVADNTLPNGLATTGYDDDGVKGQKWDIIKNGLFVGYGTNREVAHFIGEARSHGCCRADGWGNIPIVRIPNLSLMPGQTPLSLDELIADTKDGIYIEGMGSFSIDQMRYNFQFGGDAAWEIKNGKKTQMLKDVTYQAITTEFWNACDAICDKRFWVPYGITGCGKGDPAQTAQMTHGAAPARFRKIKVGGIKP